MAFEDNICPSCERDLRGAEIPTEHREHYREGVTHFSRVIGVEYSYDHPEHRDGVSEWCCPECGYREGRFSGQPLAEGEFESRNAGRRRVF